VSETCVICNKPTGDETTAHCTFCAKPFHLSMRNDITIDECGEVWINDVHLGLEFACRSCLEGANEEDGELVGLRGASDALHIDIPEVEQWIGQGRLLPVTMEKPYRFRRSDIEALVNFMRPTGGGGA
jgi:hypothetical protein